MPDTKHYVYSARTTERGLALLNKTKGDKSWDTFINEAVAAHYNLKLEVIALPPSKFIAEREANAKAKAEKKAAKALERTTKALAKAAEKKAADKAKAAKKPAKADKAPNEANAIAMASLHAATAEPNVAKEKPAKAPKATKKTGKTTKVTLNPGETKTVGDSIVHAAANNTGPVWMPVES